MIPNMTWGRVWRIVRRFRAGWYPGTPGRWASLKDEIDHTGTIKVMVLKKMLRSHLTDKEYACLFKTADRDGDRP